MGIAIISGVLESLNPSINPILQLDSQNSSGSSTPNLINSPDSIPKRFITCVSRPESSKKLKKLWTGLGREDVEVRVAENVKSVNECDVILLSFVFSSFFLFGSKKQKKV